MRHENLTELLYIFFLTRGFCFDAFEFQAFRGQHVFAASLPFKGFIIYPFSSLFFHLDPIGTSIHPALGVDF